MSIRKAFVWALAFFASGDDAAIRFRPTAENPHLTLFQEELGIFSKELTCTKGEQPHY